MLLAAKHLNRNKTSLVRPTRYTSILVLIVGAVFFSTAVADTTCQQLVIPTTVYLKDPGISNIYILADGQLGGTSANDTADLELYSVATGTFDLGAGENSNYSTCSQCVRLHQDLVGGASGKEFFQDRGTLVLTIEPGADSMPVVFSNLRLIEVTFNENFESIPVPDGECYVGADSVFADGFEN